jgi:hypothetical protein
VDQPENLLRLVQVFEYMETQVFQDGTLGKRQRGVFQSGRDHDLAAPGRRHEPRGPVGRRAVVVAGNLLRLPGVQPHPHPEFPDFFPTLRLQLFLDFERAR